MSSLGNISPRGIVTIMGDDGSTTILSKGHPRYDQVKQAVLDGEFDEALDIIQRWKYGLEEAKTEEVDSETDINTPQYNEFVCDEDVIEYHGRRIKSKQLVERMKAVGGLENPAFRRFVDRLCANPRWDSVEQLFSFLQHENLPITNDGCFIGYKAVTSTYFDKYSGKINNTPGCKPEMPRYSVEFNPSVGCSRGLHVGTYNYARDYMCRSEGDRLVLCKVDPADVVSVPTDCDYSKLRTWTYLVLCDAEYPIPGYMVFNAKGVEASLGDYSNARRDEYDQDHDSLFMSTPDSWANRSDADDDYDHYDDSDEDEEDDCDDTDDDDTDENE
jgi:hypothetical protein